MEGDQPFEERQCQAGDLSWMLGLDLMPSEEGLGFVKQ
jgi:hypothetical protein